MADARYEPRNRRATRLGVLELQVEHAGGVENFDPNGQIMQVIQHPDVIASWCPVEGATSILSGEPAIIYRADDMEVPLTVDEYLGLVGRELRPEEVLKLIDHFGMAHEWHEDFYGPETGEAFQPKPLREQFRAALAKIVANTRN
jgi:hypothetical protein